MQHIEDTIYQDYLPVNSKAMLNRIKEILTENRTNCIRNLPKEARLKVRKVLWLIVNQLGETTFNLSIEWDSIRAIEGK